MSQGPSPSIAIDSSKIFFPRKESPQKKTADHFDITCADGVNLACFLHRQYTGGKGKHSKNTEEGKKCVVYFHGNGELASMCSRRSEGFGLPTRMAHTHTHTTHTTHATLATHTNTHTQMYICITYI